MDLASQSHSTVYRYLHDLRDSLCRFAPLIACSHSLVFYMRFRPVWPIMATIAVAPRPPPTCPALPHSIMA